MLRDRLREWKCSKNFRKQGCSNRRTTAPGVHGNNGQSAQEDQDHRTYSELASLFESARASLYSPLHIPKKERFLRQTLKSVLDWQLHVTETEEGWSTISSDADQFGWQINRMTSALDYIRIRLQKTEPAIRELHETSIELEHIFQTMTPLAVLLSMDRISRLRKIGPSQQVCAATLNFLLNKATEALHHSDPALLLMRQMFLFEQSPEALAMIHEVGCLIFNCISHTSLLRFRASIIWAANFFGLSAAFKPYLETLTTEILDQKDIDDVALFLPLAGLYYQNALFDGSAQLARRCLDVLKIQGDEISWLTYEAWTYIADTHGARSDFASEEHALRNALTVAEIIEPDIAFGSGSNHLDVLETIWRLHQCYKRQNKQYECEALCLRYPHVFAED